MLRKFIMNCIYLKQKLNRNLECKKKNKIINIKECNNCKFKEYKCTKIQKNSANSTFKNTTLYNKSAKLTNCHVSKKIRQKSTKLARLEKNRFSVFTDNLDHCIICRAKKDHLHEIFFGSNRQKSMQYGFVIPLCHECHAEMHRNQEWQKYWHKKGQEYWEEFIGSREEFIEVFGKSYLK